MWAAIAQSVLRLATGWTVRGSNPGGGESFRFRRDRPWGLPSLLCNGYRLCFPGVKRPGRGVDYPPPSSAEAWAFMACSRATFTFFTLHVAHSFYRSTIICQLNPHAHWCIFPYWHGVKITFAAKVWALEFATITNSQFHFVIIVKPAISQVFLQQPKLHSSLFGLRSEMVDQSPVKSPHFYCDGFETRVSMEQTPQCAWGLF